ncbi:MAG TPA: MmgE/PrpD family protein [Thermodesulfobacteriota bacterium]
MDYLDRLAGFVHRIDLASLPREVVDAARRVVLDGIGVILAGSRLPENGRLARLVAERSAGGRATLIGHRLAADPMFAALANATAGVSLDLDEGNRFGGGHPAMHVATAALAVAEELGAGGRRLLESIVAGYEVVSRVGGATRPRFNVHSHGTWGTLGAAVAVARLHGYDAARIREVVNLAASMSPANSWVPCFEGATIRNLYPGRAALQGILAVHLHRCGFTGPRDAPSDVFGVILGDRFDTEQVVAGLGEDYRIARNYFKFHACCLYSHPTLDALQALVAEERISARDVERVTVVSVPFAERMAGRDPANPLAAKFSIPFAVAALLVTGRTDAEAFGDSTIADGRVRDLAARVVVRADPEMSMQRSDYPTATVSVLLKDGRTVSRSTTVVRGDSANPAPPAALVDKFLALAGPSIGAAGARAVVEAVDALEEVGDVRTLTARLVGPGS